jgi:hypothetical protein
MKSKKNYLTTGIIIGIGLIVVPLILMGTTNINTENEVGTYQISTTYRDAGNWVFETTIDTRTGEVISRERRNGFGKYKTGLNKD